jgi:GNAT superfamily N-acetyltransferase
METGVVTVSRATPSDHDDACDLLRAQFREHGIGLDDHKISAGIDGHLSDPSRGAVLLARAGGAPVGLAILALTWTVEHGGRVAWLEELYVVPSRRNAGTGGLLLDHALRTAKDLGCLAVDLEVDAQHARAERLYERAGFQRLPRTRWARALAT